MDIFRFVGTCLSILGIVCFVIVIFNLLPKELRDKAIDFIGKRFLTVTNRVKGEMHISGKLNINLGIIKFDGDIDYNGKPQKRKRYKNTWDGTPRCFFHAFI